MTKYILQTDKYTVIATYTASGKLKYLEAKKGVLNDATKAGHDFAHLERDIDVEYWKPNQSVKNAFFNPAQTAWLEFYKKATEGLDYRFTATDGKALKEIGKHLTSISANTNDAIESFKLILKRWDTLDPFYRHKMQLTFINSQLNTIINLIKNGKQTSGTAGSTNADDYRQGI